MRNNVREIIRQFLSGRFSPETEEKIQRWIIEEESLEDKEQASLEYWNDLEVKPNSKTIRMLDEINSRIGFSKKIVPLYKQLFRVAAVFIPLLVIAGFSIYILTKENMVELTVAYGDEKHILLPDSSEVWLNAGTTIKYPKEFKDNHRSLYLNGEAYFSVKKDPSKPFVVRTENLSVKVLGTQFNVKAYREDDRTIATLVNGKVEVLTNTKDTRILAPNEQLSFDNKTYQVSVSVVQTENATGWMGGLLLFNNASFSEISQTLERRFNVSFDYSKFPSTERYTVNFLKKESLDEVLTILQDITGCSFRKQGNKIIVTKK